MNRRSFIRFSSSALVATPLVVISAASSLGKQKSAELPHLQPGSILTSNHWNDVVARVNELTERIL